MKNNKENKSDYNPKNNQKHNLELNSNNNFFYREQMRKFNKLNNF